MIPDSLFKSPDRLFYKCKDGAVVAAELLGKKNGLLLVFIIFKVNAIPAYIDP